MAPKKSAAQKTAAKRAAKSDLVAAATAALEKASDLLADDDATTTYSVVRPIIHHDGSYAPGDEIDLTDEEAAPLLAAFIVPAPVEVVIEVPTT